MGEMVEFASNGGTCRGYLAGSSGPGVIVIQEWWGLVDHIKDVADRFAAELAAAQAERPAPSLVTFAPDCVTAGGAVPMRRRRAGANLAGFKAMARGMMKS